jgi:hypothetical protein
MFFRAPPAELRIRFKEWLQRLCQTLLHVFVRLLFEATHDAQANALKAVWATHLLICRATKNQRAVRVEPEIAFRNHLENDRRYV